MHAMGDVIDMRRFSGLRKVLPVTHILFLIGALALVGAPPLAGFWSKESILGLLLSQLGDQEHGTVFLIWLIMGLFAALLTSILYVQSLLPDVFGDRASTGRGRTSCSRGQQRHARSVVCFSSR